MLKAFVFALLSASVAFAQESSTPNPPTMALAPQDSPALMQTSTMEAPTAKSQLQLTLGSENISYEADARAYTTRSPIYSYNWVGLKYVASPKWAFKLEQNFQLASNRENTSGRDKLMHNANAFEMGEVMIAAVASPNIHPLGTSSVKIDARYYAPTDHVAQENHELGRLRSDTSLNWDLNPNWTLTAYLSGRVHLNSRENINTEKGSDAEYYYVRLAPIATYNFNDKISAYYANFTNLKSTQAQRGTWSADAGNSTTHEIGAYFASGAFLINPALTSDTSLNDGSGSYFSSGSRAYSYETLGYCLNLYATF